MTEPTEPKRRRSKPPEPKPEPISQAEPEPSAFAKTAQEAIDLFGSLSDQGISRVGQALQQFGSIGPLASMTEEERAAARARYGTFGKALHDIQERAASPASLRALGQLSISSNTHLQDTLSAEYGRLPLIPSSDELLRTEVRSLGAVMRANGEQIGLTTAAIGQLADITERGQKSADKDSRRLFWANIVLIIATVVLIGFTAILTFQTINLANRDTGPRPTPTVTASPHVTPS